MYDYDTRKIGEVCVDAGLIMVGDPCYVIPWGSWQEFADKCDGDVSQPQGDGQGIVVPTTWGDGTYPVYGVYDMPGRLIGITVMFGVDEDQIDDDDYDQIDDEEEEV